MTSRPSPRLLIPALGAVALIAVVVFSASVLLSSPASHSPSPRPTATLVALQSETPTPPPTAPPPTPTASPTPAPLPSTPPVIETALLQKTDPNGVWAVTYRYPKIKTGTTPFADAMNSTIALYVETTATQFSVGPAAAPVEAGMTNTLIGTFTTALDTPTLVSFRLKEQQNLNGVHPLTLIGTQTFDLATGQLIGLGDVFTDQTAALQTLSTKSRELLKKIVEPSDQLDAGTSADTPGNFGAWALTPAGLEITFQEYQVAPSAAGSPAIVIPWADLRSLINPSSPVATLAGD